MRAWHSPGVCGLPVQTEMTLADEDFKTGLTSMPDPVFNMQDAYSRRQDLEVIRWQGISVLSQREKLAMGQMLPKVAAVVGAYGVFQS